MTQADFDELDKATSTEFRVCKGESWSEGSGNEQVGISQYWRPDGERVRKTYRGVGGLLSIQIGENKTFLNPAYYPAES